MYFVNYKLTFNYCGRIPISNVQGVREAEEKLRNLTPSELQTLSDTSSFTISAQAEPLFDLSQLILFEDEFS